MDSNSFDENLSTPKPVDGDIIESDNLILPNTPKRNDLQ